MRVLGNRVLIRKVEPKRQTDGGLFLPDVALEHINQGEVIASANPAIDPGEMVVYPPFAGLKVVYKGEELLMVDADDILMVL